MAVPLKQMDPVPVSAVNVEVTPVRSAVDRDRFIRFQYSHYKNDPNFVPPLQMERRDFLDPKKNPFFLHAEVDLFLARRHGEIVGRIAAIHDRNYNAFWSSKTVGFGLFESIDDPGVTAALLAQVESWGNERGMTQLLGPVNFSTNQDCGILIDAFDKPPVFLMTYNPPYYPALLEAAGLKKAKDLYAWELLSSHEPPEKVVRIAEKIRAREGIVVRPANLKDLKGEIAKIKTIYNAAWERNWGFVPMTDAEFDHMAKDMKSIVIPEFLLMAEIKGEPVAFSLTLPDMNQAFAKVPEGRLTQFGLPIGLAKLLYAQKQIKWARLTALGIKEGYRRRGIDAILYLDTVRAARKLGYTGGEISWTLEDNALVNRAIESMGGKRYKTYRLYEKALSS
jgi:GNAT superfamily N-acetyltransferase